MRKAELYLADIFDALGLPQLAAMARGGQLHPERPETTAIESAQREAWNEAIEEAAKLIEAGEGVARYDRAKAIRSLHREEE